jgi:hypothetical protein
MSPSSQFVFATGERLAHQFLTPQMDGRVCNSRCHSKNWFILQVFKDGLKSWLMDLDTKMIKRKKA